jgi:hypothetical protein
MNYKRIYDSLVTNAKEQYRLKGGDEYYESHHIIPTSLGGPDTIDNRVLLTAREHYLAHWLLYKISEGSDKHKMAQAWHNMTIGNSNQTRHTSHSFSYARKACGEAVRDRLSGKSYIEIYGEEKASELIEIRRKAKTGNVHSAETRKKIGDSKRGKPSWSKGATFTEEHRDNISKSRGNESRSSKSYKIVDPNGKEYEVIKKGLPWFWENVLNEKFPVSFKKVKDFKEGKKGKWKGWKIYVLS